MNNNNLKFFIGVVLFLGIIVIAGELIYNLFGNKASTLDASIISIQSLPAEFQKDFLKEYTERGDKYMFLSVDQFESGVTPEELRDENVSGEEQIQETEEETAPQF